MQELDRLKLALNKANAVIYEWDASTGECQWSGDVHKLLGLPKDTKLQKLDDLMELMPQKDKLKFKTTHNISIQSSGDYRRVFDIKAAADNIIPVMDQGTFNKETGKYVGMLSVNLLPGARTRWKEENAKTNDNTDSHYATDAMRSALAMIHTENLENETSSVLLKLSVDNLPMMMTWYSTAFANRVMDALHGSLVELVRDKRESVFRTGFDQFTIILRNHSQSEAELVIDLIMQKAQLYTDPAFSNPIHIRCSIGSVTFPEDDSGPEEVLDRGYMALSCARSKSDAFYSDYNEARQEHLDSKEQVAQIHYMRKAMLENRLQLAFQPLISAKDGSAFGHECLLRILDEDGQVHSAGNLISVAEKLNMIDLVDHFVMEQVTHVLTQNPDIRLAFNISNLTTDDPNWLKTCNRVLKDEDVASRVIIEITETAAQHDLRQTAYFVAALQSLGAKVALDDFGAGYTSFRQLKSLSVDMVKIDGAYVKPLPDSSENSIFIRTLVDFTHSYGISTIAEYVENGEIAKTLIDIGVDYLQGYYFGKPEVDVPWKIKL